MLSKHEDHTCKECKKKFKSFMVLLKHVAEDHFKEEIVWNYEEEIGQNKVGENVRNYK